MLLLWGNRIQGKIALFKHMNVYTLHDNFKSLLMFSPGIPVKIGAAVLIPSMSF